MKKISFTCLMIHGFDSYIHGFGFLNFLASIPSGVWGFELRSYDILGTTNPIPWGYSYTTF